MLDLDLNQLHWRHWGLDPCLQIISHLLFSEGQERISNGELLPTPTEESIFAFLGLDYLPPEAREAPLI
jgi:hypothetical protein